MLDEIAAQELQRGVDAFRIRQGLSRAADTRRWLALHRLSETDLAESIERALVRQKVADQVTAGRIEKCFAENRARFDRARLRHLVVEQHGVAEELISRVQEDGADFGELARRHSIDSATKASGGSLGIVPRKRLAADVEAAVFAARHGAVVRPFKAAAGYQLVYVEEIVLGQLDEPTRVALREELFRNWIVEQMQKATFELKLDA